MIAPKKVLLVEGATEKRLVPELLEQRGIQWDSPPHQPVDIRVAGGLVTAPDLLETFLKASSLSVLGVIFDADGMSGGEEQRWEAMRDRCQALSIELPEIPPIEGFIAELDGNIRFGVWMMPNNQPPGMLETFLLGLLTPEERVGPLFIHAQKSVQKAREVGAPFKEPHADKALIHTWLAWQDEPGAQLHQAVKYKTLDAASSNADAFVSWFKGLYQL